MDFGHTAGACFRFLKRHYNTVLILVAILIASWGSITAQQAVREQEKDRVQACQNALVRANGLHNILEGILAAAPDKTTPAYAFYQGELEKLPLVYCDENGVLTPVGTSG